RRAESHALPAVHSRPVPLGVHGPGAGLRNAPARTESLRLRARQSDEFHGPERGHCGGLRSHHRPRLLRSPGESLLLSDSNTATATSQCFSFVSELNGAKNI